MPQTKTDSRRYSLYGFEKLINRCVKFFFYYRMIVVLLAVISIIILGILTWNNSLETEKVKNLSVVLSGGSIIIGIFYAVLNYENNYNKSKEDRNTARKLSSFAIASEWHKDAVVKNLKIAKKIYENNKHLIDENKSKEFSEILESDEDGRAALISIFNFLECIALGIDEEVHDEEFMKKLFKSMFISYYNDYEFYINYRRKTRGHPKMWILFTDLAVRWRDENYKKINN